MTVHLIHTKFCLNPFRVPSYSPIETKQKHSHLLNSCVTLFHCAAAILAIFGVLCTHLPTPKAGPLYALLCLDNFFLSSSSDHFILIPAAASLGNILILRRSNPPDVSL